LLGEFVPRGEGRVVAIVKDAVDARGSVSLLSIGALLWSGSRVFGAATKALNIAYDTDETYGFFMRTGVEVVMMATIGVIFVLALASRSIINIFWNALAFLPRGRDLAFQVTEATLPALLLLAAFFLIYRFVPRGQQDWRAALLGAAVATFLFLLARPVFLGYVQSFGEYNLIYGSLAIVVILALWAWLAALIMLFGGELASHTQEMLIEGRSADEVERRHQDRSPTRKGARYRPNAPQPGGDTPAESWGRPTERPSVMATLVIVAFLAGATFFRRWSRR
jgi:YihY family inner membrane protein